MYMYKQNLAENNQQWLIYHKTKCNQTRKNLKVKKTKKKKQTKNPKKTKNKKNKNKIKHGQKQRNLKKKKNQWMFKAWSENHLTK